MAWRVLLSKFRGLFLAERSDRNFDEELDGHLNLLTERYMRQGMPPDEARHAAWRQFGGITKVKEERRENLGIAHADVFWQDTRHALRGLRKNPVFSLVVVFLLALGLCAAVAIFGFVDAALIKPLPYRDQSRLVGVFEADATNSRSFVSYLDYADWKNFNKVFSSIDAFAENGSFTLTNRAGAQQVPGTRVSNGFFRTLGVTPVLGRDFQTGENFSVMLSYAAWQKRFGGRQDVLGQVVTLSSAPHIIIGVLPRDFHFAPYAAAEFWGPLHASDICERNRNCNNLGVIARLKDGVSVQGALAGMKSVARQVEKQHPDSHRDESANVAPLSEVIVGDVRPILLVLLSGAGLLLLIACINVTSLLLARSDGRKREMAIRNALGASPTRLFRQFATEALVLVTIGSLLGLISAEWVMQLLTRVMPTNMLESMPYLRGLGLNFRVVAFACAISLIAGALFAATPILRVSLGQMLAGLKEGGRGSAGTMWRRFGANLVVMEVATAMVLMVGAGLLGQSLYRLLHVDTGLQPDHLATLGLGWTSFSGYSKDEQLVALEREIVRRISALPGVKSAGIAMTLPVGSGWGTTSFRVVGRPYHGEQNEAFRRPVSSAYFTTLQARLLRGRYFSETEDTSKPRVVIINQTLAKRFFPGQDPIGKQISYDGQPQSAMQIVGVVDDIKEGPLDTVTGAAVYVPFNQSPVGGFAIAVRTSQAEQSLLPALAAIIHQIDPSISIDGGAGMTEVISQSPTASLHRFSAWLVGSFAAIAFVLGVVGLYGVVAYSVSQRTREIGVRMALGARPTSVYQLILREAAWLAGAGIAMGIVCSLAAATLMRGMLFGVHSWDVPTLAAVAVVLGVSALLASYIPARRAASVNPVEALRAE